MLKATYDKVNKLFEEGHGYVSTRKLLQNHITTIQIRTLLDQGKIEKISHGNYWSKMSKKRKPKHYKMVEACLTNRRAVICALSACYYHGLIDWEPDVLYVATARNDRSGMQLNFPVSRHYFSISSFEDNIVNARTGGTDIRVYDIDRSVCDCIRLEREIGKEKVQMVVDCYKKDKRRRPDRLLAYASRMRFGKIARQYLED